MNKRIYVRLDQSHVQQLVRIAEAERRHPADQAALMLERALLDEHAEKRGERDVLTSTH
jgi:hypothetical protein